MGFKEIIKEMYWALFRSEGRMQQGELKYCEDVLCFSPVSYILFWAEHYYLSVLRYLIHR